MRDKAELTLVWGRYVTLLQRSHVRSCDEVKYMRLGFTNLSTISLSRASVLKPVVPVGIQMKQDAVKAGARKVAVPSQPFLKEKQLAVGVNVS